MTPSPGWPQRPSLITGIRNLSIETGNTIGLNLIYVQATNVPTNLITDGLQWVIIGQQGSVQNIKGSIKLSGYSFLTVDDSADKSNRTATLSTLDRRRLSSRQSRFRTGTRLDRVFVHGHQLVDITTGSGTNTVNVLGTGVPTTLINEPSQENVYVGYAAWLSGIQGILTVENEGASPHQVAGCHQSPARRLGRPLGQDRSDHRFRQFLSITGLAPVDWTVRPVA